ncbi:undecaprenyldiphospho-muramoylpentapeptide beta-N-acetylglucosaminyltransferase [Maridesulfovibrio hydrothermalis]|uniref:UDP-N-acetylglucosamine--N-acetylmuramyl-(pentapeptide) pyrophosphoryl-undecaprenol N-acetylglucosamine transferase n=1 Tax=Maridesulfovibrio hydrothermalis AM13 = DSM 14728 TaxID=1121451 RepID=L0RAB7_9BACT|nr:undecaprenyldiphospho-muramoylpentapeptide beta-N-acetylglucosaminyltransferase [Maridesulfovibrio hydrothermalis]CCO22501.1 UDP-N-acetylglucosamine--N-acetylmuramyl-(pentapeptide) pyrophosphoryl-undecaprenol N-acetylglucosamine transferase [Maridesulfovibrio hydrothermalis AM13 = DSM 14728]
MKRIILTTGGTGGHVFPALAVAHEIKSRFPDCEILFLGGNGPEKEMAKRAGIAFKGLPAKGVMGGGLAKILGSFWIVPSMTLAIKEVMTFSPDAIIGFGGYAGFCPVLAGWMLGIPTAVHEQNSVPGMTNRILGKVVKKVFTSFADNSGSFPEGKVAVTGNPVRKEIINSGKTAADKSVLVFGGSQGAAAINNAIVEGLSRIKDSGITLRHQTGKADYEKVRAAYEQAGFSGEAVSPFIHNMAEAYANAQLVVCRSGASTIFEVAAAGKPAIFIPFPYATHDHQTGNANSLAGINAAIVIPQKDLNGDLLAEEILKLISDQNKLKEMGNNALSFAKPDAASVIVDGIENIIRMRTIRGVA